MTLNVVLPDSSASSYPSTLNNFVNVSVFKIANVSAKRSFVLFHSYATEV